MKVFKVKMTGNFLTQFLREGLTKCIVVQNPIPDDAELISTEFDWGTRCLVLYYISNTLGTMIPEGASMKDCEELLPIYKRMEA